jgi:drug/metabolite transporter (DMT)-like permease
MNALEGRLLALCAAVLFSTGGAGLKTDAFSVAQTSAMRSGIAAVVLILWLRNRIAWSNTSFVVGVAYAATVSLFVASTKLTTAANAIFVQSSAPLYLILLAPWLLRERFRTRDLAYLVIVGVGLWLCLQGTPTGLRTAPNPSLGNALAVVCSLTWALTLLGLRYVERRPEHDGLGLSAVVIGNSLACLMALPFAWPFPEASMTDWFTLLYLGTIQIGLAYVCLTRAVRQLPALEVSLLLLVEPVLNPIWTWLLRGEEPGRLVIAGGAVILLTTALRAVLGGRTAAPIRSVPPSV